MLRITELVLVGVVAALHAYFLVMEMFLWQTSRVRIAFSMTENFARESAVLAKNQGLYNGFLAAGLIWSLIATGSLGFDLRVFFLACVAVAGVFGGVTANRRIFIVQALPGAVALMATLAIG